MLDRLTKLIRKALGRTAPTSFERSLGDFIKHVARAGSYHRGDADRAEEHLAKHYGPDTLGPYAVEYAKTALAETSGTIGGYLVPEELREDINTSVEELAIVRPRAFVVPMKTATLKLPIPVTTAQVAGVAPYFGGLQPTWNQESVSLPESEPTFAQVELKAKELCCISIISNPLLQDGLGIEAVLRKLLTKAISWGEDYAFLRGTGAGQPLGILNSSATIQVARANASHFGYADSAAMAGRLLPYSWPHAIWVMHPLALVDMLTSEGALNIAWQSNQPRETGGPVGTLHTMPVYVSGSLPSLGTPGDVMLFDPTLYAIGDRQVLDIQITGDDPLSFKYYRSVIRTISRVDGQPMFPAPITLPDATNTVSAYVALK
jgi:HK97 family phage major capsid protein